MGFSYDSEKRSTRAFSTFRNAGRFIAHTNSTQTRPDGYGFEPILTKHMMWEWVSADVCLVSDRIRCKLPHTHKNRQVVDVLGTGPEKHPLVDNPLVQTVLLRVIEY